MSYFLLHHLYLYRNHIKEEGSHYDKRRRNYDYYKKNYNKQIKIMIIIKKIIINKQNYDNNKELEMPQYNK